VQNNGQGSRLPGRDSNPELPEKKHKGYSLNRNFSFQQALKPYYLLRKTTEYLAKSKGIITVQVT
jgi:hypothetical protein